MLSVLKKRFHDVDEIKLEGMISYTRRVAPYVQFSSLPAVKTLANLMLNTSFCFERKETPLCSSYNFLQRVGSFAGGPTSLEEQAENAGTTKKSFEERDFIFLVKMFGFSLRRANSGVIQIVEELDIDDDPVTIDDEKSAKELEFYISEIQKHTRIQLHSIESSTKRLLRDWREVQLAYALAEKVNKENYTIGRAKDFLRDNCAIKDHEFVRIREHALNLDLLTPKRKRSDTSRRVSIDEDVIPFIDDLSKKLSKGRHPLTFTQAVNRALRDFRQLIIADPKK